MLVRSRAGCACHLKKSRLIPLLPSRARPRCNIIRVCASITFRWFKHLQLSAQGRQVAQELCRSTLRPVSSIAINDSDKETILTPAQSRARLSPLRWSLLTPSTMSSPRSRTRRASPRTNSVSSSPANSSRMAAPSLTTTYRGSARCSATSVSAVECRSSSRREP